MFGLFGWGSELDEAAAVVEESIHIIEGNKNKKKQEQRSVVMKMYCKGE